MSIGNLQAKTSGVMIKFCTEEEEEEEAEKEFIKPQHKTLL